MYTQKNKITFPQLLKTSSLLLLCIAFFSCEKIPNIINGKTAAENLKKNACGLLVFSDSIQLEQVSDYLENEQAKYEQTPGYSTATDEEKPLTDFELSKNHPSYRSFIATQEDAAENSGVDLSVNPVPEVLEDDEILQTLLNKDRMLVIDETVYYYHDDCTLFKFPAGKNCKIAIDTAMAYFKEYEYNQANHIKPSFNFEKIDICQEEAIYKTMTGFCPDIELLTCVADECHPEDVNFFMSIPNYYQTGTTLTDFKYIVNGNTFVLNVSNATTVNVNPCGWSVGTYGFGGTITFPNTNTNYNITMEAKFSYEEDGATKTCTQTKTVSYFVKPPCPIKEEVSINGLIVTIKGINNPCTPGADNFTFNVLHGAPVVSNQTGNSIQLRYSCAGPKKVIIYYNSSGCQSSKEISVDPVDPSLCCPKNLKMECKHSFNFNNGNSNLKIKLKERRNRLVAVVRMFNKTSKKKKKTSFTAYLNGPLYYYKETCNCLGIFDFSEYKNITRKKLRIKFKLNPHRNTIKNLPGVASFNWFKENWSRKNNDLWYLKVTATGMSGPEIFKIGCSNSNTCVQ